VGEHTDVSLELSCLSDMLSNYMETKLTDQTDNLIPVDPAVHARYQLGYIVQLQWAFY